MSRVEIRPIQHPRDTVAFVKTWWRVYRDDPHWVPPLISERKRFFNPKVNPYFETAECQCFIAYRGDEAVGTISATIDGVYQKEDPGTGFFGFFEFIDDIDVAGALLETAGDWLRARGMKKLIGPFNFNTNHEFGLLVDGFDIDPMVANPHNSAYFPVLYEKLGLVKAMDWYAYRTDVGGESTKRMKRIAEFFLKRHPEVRIRPLDMKNFDKEIELLHEIYNDAWEQNWAHVRATDAEFDYIAAGFKQILDPTLSLVAEVDGVAAGMSITLPNFNQVAKKMNGRILPFGWYHFLTARRTIDSLRVFMLGVKQEYQSMPLGAPLYNASWERAVEMGMSWAEASLILETNTKMRSPLEKMGLEIYKTYRSYSADLT